jgi:hypothetical protein
VTLEHGLTFDRVNSIEANGPDENFVDQKRGHSSNWRLLRPVARSGSCRVVLEGAISGSTLHS